MYKLILLITLFSGAVFATWNKQNPLTNENFNDIYVSQSTDLVYVVGDNGTMYLSENSGNTWTQITSNLISDNINSVIFTTTNVGYVTTSFGEVFRTLNKGTQFSRLFTNNNNESINEIYFLDNFIDIGYVVGNAATYRKTTNGGASWSSIQYNFNNASLNSIYFNGLQTGVIVGNNGAVFNTTNGGSDWTSRTITGVSENLNSVVHTGNGNVFIAVGDNGKIARSVNNGQSWQVITSNTNENLNNVHFTPNSSSGFIVGDNGIILFSNDNGVTWSEQVNNDSENLNSIAFKNGAIGFAVGENGTILSTLSAGQNQNVTLTSPVGSETWVVNENVAIEWSAVGIDEVKIEISRDNKNSWGQLAIVDADLGVYNWTVVSPISNEVFIRISDNDNENLNDESGQLRITNFNLSITSPSLNDELNINSNHNITWNASNVDNIDIYFSTNNESSWNLIEDEVQASLGQFTWAIGNTPTNQGKIKIENSSDASQYVISEQFTILGANLFLLNPNNGSFDAGDIVEIEWQSQNVSKLRIDYTTNGGVSWAGIATNYNASIGSYSWLVPYKPGQAQIRIMSEEDNELFAISNQSFTINGYDLTILNPLGGSSYVAGSNVTIQWQADDRIENIKIEYSSNGGTNWTVIQNSVNATTGSYLWTTPNQAGENYKIRLTDGTGQIKKVSNTFSLSKLQIITPIANSTIKANTEYMITWEAVGLAVNTEIVKAFSWGKNTFGELGIGNNISRNSPNEVENHSSWKEIISGDNHTLGIKLNGTLWSWGDNTFGQLGDGSQTSKNLPQQVGNDNDWKKVSTGYNHTILLKNDGSIWGCGNNTDGQLGNGQNQNEVLNLIKIGNDNDWKDIQCGGRHTLAIKENGSLWAWGHNGRGQLGSGNTIDSNIPNQIGNETNWVNIIAGGGSHCLAINSVGELWAWGRNDSGQLGVGSNNDIYNPTKVEGDNWKQVSSGYWHTVGVKNDGSIWTWGRNDKGQLGDGTIVNQNTPKLIQFGSSEIEKAIANSRWHSVALNNDGEIYSWGENSEGQLGIGNNLDVIIPTKIGNDNSWTDISTGSYQTFGLKNIEISEASINLSYSTNNGTTWQNIASNIKAEQGQINQWTTPNINANILLRIENANDETQFHSINLTIQKAEITINSPETDLFYRSGEDVVIDWSSNLIEYVDIHYSVNGGNFISIAENVIASEGSFTWTAPILESNQVKIRIEDSSNNLIFAESGEFGISDDVITILSPNGNEIWNQGETREIIWEADDAQFVDIHITNDNGQTWQLIAEDIDAASSYNWTIGTTPGAKTWLKVTDSDKPGIDDITDASFVINGLNLTSPNGGETYLLSTTEQITWKSVGMNSINIYYSKNNGSTWVEIVKNYPAASGFYNWNIPAMTGDEFKIRVLDPTKTNFIDISESTFNINGIKITSPVAGDRILFGTQKLITFDKFDIQNIKIEHSTDNGATWYTVIAHTNGTSGQYLWDVPEMPGTQNKLKITSIEVPTLYDITSSTFEIMNEGIEVTYPNGGETLAANTSHTITWASANIDSVKIEYSADNGSSWNVITSATKASNKYFAWTTPNINGDKYLVRITDTKIEDITDVSDANFNIDGGVYILPDDWDFTMGTGKTSHIIVPNNINPKVGNVNIEVGDVIGIFYMDNGAMKCGGYNTWTGEDLAITAWGNNSLTTKKDGFDDDEEYNIRVWDESTGNQFDVTVTYSSGNSFFTENGISVLSSFETQRPFNINLEGGTWQLISSNLIPANPLISDVLKDVKDDIEYIKNDLGQIYYPDQSINQIGDWNVVDGYQIYSHDDATLSIVGNTILPANYNFTFNANFWYIISYLPNDVRNIADVFAGLENVILVKNSDGEIYYPAFGINQIGTMRTGEGYQIAVSQNAQTFSYTNNPPAPAPANPGIFSEEEEEDKYYQSEISKTGSSAIIVFNNIENWNGEIGVFDSYDRLVGHGKINSMYNSITVWGDNSITFDKDGAKENEVLRLEFYDYENKSVRQVEIEQIFELVSSKDYGKNLTYQKDAIFNIEATKVSSSVDDNYIRTSIYPNPASEIIYLNISGEGLYNLDVIDMTGNTVISREVTVTGQSTLKIDINQLQTGAYILNIRGSGSISTQKFIKIE